MGARATAERGGAIKVLQTKNIFRGSSEPRGIAS